MTTSLRRRLLAILLGLTLAAWLVSIVATAVVAQQMIVRQAEKQIQTFMGVANSVMVAILQDPAISDYFSRRAGTRSMDSKVIRLRDFGVVGGAQSANFWYRGRQFVLSENPPFPAPTGEGFVTVTLGADSDDEWRVLYRHDRQHDAWLAIGINMSSVQSIAAAAFWKVALPLLIVLPVTAAILFWGVGRGLRPLESLARKIAARKPSALTPIDTGDVPLEIKPVVDSVNDLLGRLERALSSESRFTANAAHELQTPLAAIKTSVQHCEREAADHGVRKMLGQISSRIDRATATVRQLLTLARLEPDQSFERKRVDLRSLLTEMISHTGGVAAERGVELRIVESSRVFVEGHEDWLAILLQNLLVNAFLHSPEASYVEVRLERQGEHALLAIANDCEPIADEDLKRLTERFFRPPRGRQDGAGLGLSIAQRIAELHGADLRLVRWNGARGLKVEVRFPYAGMPDAAGASVAPA